MMTIERKARVCLNKNSLTLHMLCLEYTDVNTPNRAQWTFDVWADGRLLPLQIIGFQYTYEINGCIRNAGGSRSICWAHVFLLKRPDSRETWQKIGDVLKDVSKQAGDSYEVLTDAITNAANVQFQVFVFLLFFCLVSSSHVKYTQIIFLHSHARSDYWLQWALFHAPVITQTPFIDSYKLSSPIYVKFLRYD